MALRTSVGTGTHLLDILAANTDDRFRMKMAVALLRYAVDPHGDHGLGASFLYEILCDISESWPSIDQSLLGSIGYHPWIPDLDIEVTDVGTGRFVIAVRYETALYTIGFETQPILSHAHNAEHEERWSHIFEGTSQQTSFTQMPQITMCHRGIVWIHSAITGDNRTEQVDADVFHRVPWRPTCRDDRPQTRSVQELIAAVIQRGKSGYLGGIDQDTENLLLHLHHAVGNSFRFARPRAHA